MQHTEESRLELKKLEDQLEILLENGKNVPQFFKDNNVKKMIDNVLENMKIEPGLQKINGIGNLFDGKSKKTSTKIVIDHFLRQYSILPKSQILLHYPGMAPSDRFVPRRSFNLPAFYAHYCAENESIVDTMSRIPEAYLPGLDYINQEVDILIADHGVSVVGPPDSSAHQGKSSDSFGTNPYARLESQRMTVVKFNKQKGIQDEFKEIFERADEKILFRGHHFKLEDGQVIDEEENYFIKCYLNNNEIPDALTIRKIQFHGSEDVQILVLFDQWFMAAGRLRKRNNSGDQNPFYLDLVEVVGSFGTTDFYTSPGFKTVLRICCYKGEESVEERGPEKLEEAKRILVLDMIQMLDRVQKAYVKLKEENAPTITHPETGEPNGSVLHYFCHCLSIFPLIFKTYKESPNLDEFLFKSPRERLHYAFYRLHKTHEYMCKKGDFCVNLKRFLGFCRIFLKEFKKKTETSAVEMEVAEQFRNSLSMVHVLLSNGPESFDCDLIKMAAGVMNPPRIYSLDANFVYPRYLIFPKYIRPMILDILCQNELPSNHHLIHHIYSLGRDVNTQQKCENDVLEAMKRHPHVILFSTNSKMPTLGLVKQMGHFWDGDSECPGAPGSRIQILGSTGSTDSGSSDSGIGTMDPGSQNFEREGSVEKVEKPRRPSGGSPVEAPDRSSEEPEERQPPSTVPATSGYPEGRTPNKRAASPLSPLQPIKIKKVVEEAVVARLAEDFERGETSHDEDTTTEEPSPANTMEMEDDDYRTPTPPPVSTEPCSSKQAYGDEPVKDNYHTPSPPPPESTEPCSSKQAYGDEPVKVPKTPRTPKTSKTPETPSDSTITPIRKRPGSPFTTGEPEEIRTPDQQKIRDNFNRCYFPEDLGVEEVPIGQQPCVYQRTRPPRDENPETKSPAANTRSHDMSLSLKRRRFY